MRFTISSSVLNSRLQILAKAINSKSTLRVLDCFLFECKNQSLHITASDTENTLQTTIALDTLEGEGRFAVPNKNMLDALKELPEQPLTFDIDLDTHTISLSYQNGVSRFAFQPCDEYPAIESNAEGRTSLTMTSSILLDSIARSLFATDNNDVRPVMNGIYFDITDGKLALVATDGHKLVRNLIFNVDAETTTSFILPKKPATLLRNSLSKDDSEVIIEFTQRNAEFVFGEYTLICRLIEGRYPNYNAVIPQGNPNELTVDRKSLLSTIKRVLPFASASSQLVRLSIESGKLTVSSEDIDFATSAKESILCDYNGMNLNIGFGGNTLLEILNSLDSEEVCLKLADPSRAGVVTPVTQPENQEILMLIMPMILND